MPLGPRITAVRQHGAVIAVQGVQSKDKSQHNSNHTHTHAVTVYLPEFLPPVSQQYSVITGETEQEPGRKHEQEPLGLSAISVVFLLCLLCVFKLLLDRE